LGFDNWVVLGYYLKIKINLVHKMFIIHNNKTVNKIYNFEDGGILDKAEILSNEDYNAKFQEIVQELILMAMNFQQNGESGLLPLSQKLTELERFAHNQGYQIGVNNTLAIQNMNQSLKNIENRE
jgi:hypothetical protein